MLYAALPFLAAFPHILYQSNILLSQSVRSLELPLGITGIKGGSLDSELSSCLKYCCCSVVVLSTIIMSGLILLRVAAAPPCKKPLSTGGSKPLACKYLSILFAHVWVRAAPEESSPLQSGQRVSLAIAWPGMYDIRLWKAMFLFQI